MDRNDTLNRQRAAQLLEKLKKFKYPALVLALGAVLLLWPGREQKPAEVPAAEPEPVAEAQTTQAVEQQLSRLLSRIEGAGQVEVMLSLQAGEQTVWQTDESGTEGTESAGASHSRTTVLVSQDGGQSGLAVQQLCPQYRGAIIACQGADSAAVRLSLVNAVAALTGLPADQITVVKMKS